MGASKIDICNIALALIGEGEIRSFNENNIRSRMCDKLFDLSRNYIMSLFDWPFCRGFIKLQQLDLDEDALPSGYYGYMKPSDCVTPVDIYPRGTDVKWSLEGEMIVVQQSEDVYLYYTKKIQDAVKFSDGFVTVMATHLASRLAVPLKKDKALGKDLLMIFKEEMDNVGAVEANVGSEYIAADENPWNDTFVSPPDANLDSSLKAELIRRGLY